MVFDRDGSLKKAEKLLRQGRLDGAIAEYLKVVENQPGDWASANALGDLYGRAGRLDDAVAQYARIAEHFLRDGFLPKAAALYKKILKIRRDDEHAQLQLAEIAVRQGLLADARMYLTAVGSRRRARGDRRGEAEILVRLGSVDPCDFKARLTAARTLEDLGESGQAAEWYKAVYDDLTQRDRPAEALDALRQFVRLTPEDVDARRVLARAALDAGDAAALREFLDRETAKGDAGLVLALAKMALQAGEHEQLRELAPALLTADPEARPALLDLAWSVLPDDRDVALACIGAYADAALAASRPDDALDVLQAFLRRVPRDIGALQKLIEVCIDAGREVEMMETQARLADAYLDAGHADEARVIAEDLVAREPWEEAHLERFRRALTMLGEPDPGGVIALRLSGDAPFTALDPFSEAADFEPPPAAGSEVPVPAESPAASVAVVDNPEPRLAESRADEDIDLTGAFGLGGLSDDPEAEARPAPPALEAVFQQMRDQVQTAPDYSAQHLTLGRTYLEIGMIQEGISALKTAARSSRVLFEAASILGRFYQQRDDITQAIEWLERAAEAAAPDSEDGRALLYDLGVTLELAGERERALAVFRELRSDATSYRDVAARIDRLGRGQLGE